MCGGGERFRKILSAPRAAEGHFDLAVVWESMPQPLSCETLLLWEGAVPQGELRAGSVVSCGFSPRSSLTLASFSAERAVLSVQRSILRSDGRCILPQDLPLPKEWAELTAAEQVMLAGVALLM